jgi:anhydro-N-acetylmuramic acid kinase
MARLARLAEKPERTIVGLMSGTSLDGLDIALCRIAGCGEQTRAAVERFLTAPYSEAQKERLREVVFRQAAPLQAVCEINPWLAQLHATLVLDTLQKWRIDTSHVDALASHGQTVFHTPAARATLQLADGDHLAVLTGLLTLSDFRQKELAGGGEGAPLAPYAEALLYRAERPRVLLNIGGIANFTWLPPRGDSAAPISGDTGPGNTLIDRAIRRNWPGRRDDFDRDGAAAADGRVSGALLEALKAHPYFARPCPKSTGPEEFGANYLETAIAAAEARHGPLSAVDVVATLTQLTAQTVSECLRREIRPLSGTELIVSGGGRHNVSLVRRLAALLPELRIEDSAVLGVVPDAKEALLFAVLANETLAGPGFLARDGSGRRLSFGKVSFPD